MRAEHTLGEAVWVMEVAVWVMEVAVKAEEVLVVAAMGAVIEVAVWGATWAAAGFA